MNPVESIGTIVPLLLNLGFDPLALAILTLILAVPVTLVLLGIGLATKWVWDRLRGTDSELPRPAGRHFIWAILGTGGLTWLALALIITRPPGGPRPETAAVSNLRWINTAQVTYLSFQGNYGTISNLIEAGLLDPRFDNTVFGYVFKVTLSDKDYIATAMPASRETGKYGFVSKADAVIRYAEAATEMCRPCFPKGMSGTPVP